MSSPIFRNNKPRGLERYAPRQAAHRSASPDPAAHDNQDPSDGQAASENEATYNKRAEFADPSASPTASEFGANDPREISEHLAGRHETEGAAIEEWLAQVIHDAIERKQVVENHDTDAPQIKGQDPLLATPAGDTTADRKLRSSVPQRSGSRTANPSISTLTPAYTTPLRPPRLEPEIVPEPPAAAPRSGGFWPVVRLSLVMIFAAIAAYGLISFSSLHPLTLRLKGDNDHAPNSASSLQQVQSDTRPPSRLRIEDQQAFVNEPLLLAIDIENTSGGESVLLNGLAQGSTLSAGASLSRSGWLLPAAALHGLYLYAPKDFIGVMNTDVDLLGVNRSVLDSRAVQLRWIVKQPKPVPPVAAASAELTTAGHVDVTRPVLGLLTIAPTAPLLTNTPIAPTIAPIDPGEASMLMQQGHDLLSTGDVSAARVAFGRLADAGNAEAVLALANTYDPNYLAAHNFLGVQGDRATARALYQKANQLGSAEASQFLARMGSK